MSKPFLAAFAIAIAAVAGIVYWIFASTEANHIEPKGKILSVRATALDESHSAVLVEFSMTNLAGVPMTIRTIDLEVLRRDGSKADGSPIAASDVPMLFRYHGELGAMSKTAVRERERIAPNQTVERVAAQRVDLPLAETESRKGVKLTIEDVTGPKLELTAK